MTFRQFVVFGLLRSLAVHYGAPTWAQYVITGVAIAVCIIVPYILGQYNFAIIISRKYFGHDVRDFGSGNGGTTNMLRTFGKKYAILTLVGDMGKAVISCLLGYVLYGRLGAFIAGLFCVVGHMMPVKYKFKGGKGVACAAAVILMTDLGNPYYVPVMFIILLACFCAMALGIKMVSLASVMCMLIYPLILAEVENLIEPNLPERGLYIIIAFIISVLIIFMHRENIKRMLHGEESKLDLTGSLKPLYKDKAEETGDTENNDAEPKNVGERNPYTSKKKNKRK